MHHSFIRLFNVLMVMYSWILSAKDFEEDSYCELIVKRLNFKYSSATSKLWIIGFFSHCEVHTFSLLISTTLQQLMTQILTTHNVKEGLAFFF